MIDEDEVGLKEKLDSQFCYHWQLQTRKPAGSSLPVCSCEWLKSTPRRTTYRGTVDGRETPVQGLLFCLRMIYNGPPSRPHHIACYAMQGDGYLLLPRSIIHGYNFTRPPSRGRTYFCPFREPNSHVKITIRSSWSQF